jgi:hypothetical protein
LSNGKNKECGDAELKRLITPTDIYKEGSASLRNYSNLTMTVRTLAVHLFLGSAVALAVASSKNPPELPKYLLWGAACLALFSISLLCINWHFATAFNVIRNSMAALEREAEIPTEGPWQGHQRVRGSWKDPLAYSAPFTALFLLAMVAAVEGLQGMKYVDLSVCSRIVAVGLPTALVAILGAWATWDRKGSKE